MKLSNEINTTLSALKNNEFTGDLFCIEEYYVEVNGKLSDEEAIISAMQTIPDEVHAYHFFKTEDDFRAVYEQLKNVKLVAKEKNVTSFKSVTYYTAELITFDEGTMTDWKELY